MTMLISATRLHLRSFWYLLPFMIWGERTVRQAMRSPGCRGGKLLLDRGLTFWTMTAWDSEAQMLAFRNSRPHLNVMPKITRWCDEAVSAHWEERRNELPDWPDAHRYMVSEGSFIRLPHASPAHQAKQIPPVTTNRRFERTFQACLK